MNSLPMQSSTAQSTLASLPMISSENDDFPMISPMSSFVASQPTNSTRMSPIMNTRPPVQAPAAADSDEEALSDSSSGSSSSDSSDSDSDTGNVPVPTATNGMY